MKLTWKDGLAAACVGCAVAVYGLWMSGIDVLGLTSTRAISAVVLILGMAGCFTARSFFEAIYRVGSATRPPTPYVVLVSAMGVVALLAAAVALIAGSTAALTTLIVAMVTLFAMATVRHLTMTRADDLAGVG